MFFFVVSFCFWKLLQNFISNVKMKRKLILNVTNFPCWLSYWFHSVELSLIQILCKSWHHVVKLNLKKRRKKRKKISNRYRRICKERDNFAHVFILSLRIFERDINEAVPLWLFGWKRNTHKNKKTEEHTATQQKWWAILIQTNTNRTTKDCFVINLCNQHNINWVNCLHF